MIAVDTNVLVRVLVDDATEPRHVAAARSALDKAEEVFVPQVVQAELVWAMVGAFGLAKTEIVAALDHLRENPAYHLQSRGTFESALENFRRGPADFADYLILAESRVRGVPLLTFDRQLLKADDTRSP